MNKLVCDICGGKIVVQAGGQYGECENCGASYTLDRMRELASGIKVSVTGTVEDVGQWKALVDTYIRAEDYDAVEKTVKKILEAAPTDDYANEKYAWLRYIRSFEIERGKLLKYNGKDVNVTIPDGVTSIEDAFSGNEILENVTIPNSVTVIGHAAFERCTGLKSVAIPNSVTVIGYGAFQGCTSLTDVTIPNSVTEIGFLAFQGCANLTGVTIPNSVTAIASSAFTVCTGLTRVTIPSSVKFVGSHAFENCTGLTSVTIASSATSVGSFAFKGCHNITSVNVPGDSQHIFLFAETPYYYKMKGLCQHCGGEFKGVFSKTCSKCHKPKDY